MTLNRRDLLISSSGVAAAVAASNVATENPAFAQAPRIPTKWDREVDVVIIGSGATGLPAAIVAREAGSTVILLEAEKDIGGHAITSGGNVPLGGGTSAQKKHGIEDSRTCSSGTSRTGRLSNATAFRITDTTTGRLSAHSPTTAHPHSSGWLLTAWFSSTRHPTPLEEILSETRCRGKCTAP
jgi:hypothetical protein